MIMDDTNGSTATLAERRPLPRFKLGAIR